MLARSGQGAEGAGPCGGCRRQGKGSWGAKAFRGAGKGGSEPGQCQDQRRVTLLRPCLPSAASYAVFSPAQSLPAACCIPWQGQGQHTAEFGRDLLAVVLTPLPCRHQLWVPGSHRGSSRPAALQNQDTRRRQDEYVPFVKCRNFAPLQSQAHVCLRGSHCR